MRVFGYCLIIFGFLWICFWQLEIQPIARAVVLHHYDLLPKQQSFSLDEVRNAMRDTTYDFSEHIRKFYIGAIFMLGGGVIIDRVGRHKSVSQ
jgi:hypothetical protein